MKKVLINVCYGGFGCVTKQFADRFEELTGKKMRTLSFGRGFYKLDEDDRENPIAIQIVEELGIDNMKAGYSEYSIEIVPDGFDYTIDEYDGYETLVLVPVLDVDKLISLSTNRDELKKYLDELNIRHSE